MSKKGGKHKRGARGSTEEELTLAKRPNMAAEHVEEASMTESPEDDKADEEPSLSELKEMLVDIQITVSNILMENKRRSSDISELKSTVAKQNLEITNLKTSLAKTEKKLNAAVKETTTLRDRLNEQEEEIYELYDLQDRLEQRRIINKANEMRRDGELISAWSLDGKIYVKTSPEGRPIRIDELEDLDYL
ncbi:hypothetical protein ACROYT_G036149 [Oculina patagonica]